VGKNSPAKEKGGDRNMYPRAPSSIWREEQGDRGKRAKGRGGGGGTRRNGGRVFAGKKRKPISERGEGGQRRAATKGKEGIGKHAEGE